MATVDGALNCIDLLLGIAEPFYSMTGGDPGKKWLQEFDQCRLPALRMLLDIAKHHDDALVRFLIRKKLLPRFQDRDASPEIKNLRTEILQAIPETQGLDLIRILLSNRYDEFSPSYQEDATEGVSLQKLWDDLSDMVAKEMATNRPQDSTLPELCEEAGTSLKAHGLDPHFHSLFQAFERLDPSHAEALRNHILHYPESCFSYLYGNLCMDGNVENSDRKLSEGADLSRLDLFAAVCDWLHRQPEKTEFPISIAKIANECRGARGASIDTVLRAIHFSYLKSSFSFLLLENLPWREMNAAQLAEIGKKMDKRSGRISDLPVSIYSPLLARLNELPWEAAYPLAGILREACRKLPALAFDFFEERMRKATAADEEKSPHVFPPSHKGRLSFPDTTEIPDYESRARSIFDALRSDSSNLLLKQWFRIAVVDSGNLAVSFLKEWIATATDAEDLEEVSGIISSDASRFAFSEPDLVKILLVKAESFSRDCFKNIEDELVGSLGCRARGYTNGIPDDQRILNRSRELREHVAGEPLLYGLFDRVVRYEEADADQHRRDFQKREEERRQFE
jgi:hypothetical protein